MTAPYLFDSYALLALFQKEKGADAVSKIIQDALTQNVEQLICAINLGEIIYLTKRRFGDEKKLEILGRIHQLGVKILPIPDSLVFRAAEIKSDYSISYADCFCVACAIEHSAVLVTGDPDFQSVAHRIQIEWI